MFCCFVDSIIPASEFLALKHKSRILGHSSTPVCGFSMMEQVRLCAVWPMENWLGSSLNQIQGWNTVEESYSHALDQSKDLCPVPSMFCKLSFYMYEPNMLTEGRVMWSKQSITRAISQARTRAIPGESRRPPPKPAPRKMRCH